MKRFLSYLRSFDNGDFAAIFLIVSAIGAGAFIGLDLIVNLLNLEINKIVLVLASIFITTIIKVCFFKSVKQFLKDTHDEDF